MFESGIATGDVGGCVSQEKKGPDHCVKRGMQGNVRCPMIYAVLTCRGRRDAYTRSVCRCQEVKIGKGLHDAESLHAQAVMASSQAR
jgi:hypothetical protein